MYVAMKIWIFLRKKNQMKIKIKVLFLFLKRGWGLGRGLAPLQVFNTNSQLITSRYKKYLL